jgi:hypothetical protein
MVGAHSEYKLQTLSQHQCFAVPRQPRVLVNVLQQTFMPAEYAFKKKGECDGQSIRYPALLTQDGSVCALECVQRIKR